MDNKFFYKLLAVSVLAITLTPSVSISASQMEKVHIVPQPGGSFLTTSDLNNDDINDFAVFGIKAEDETPTAIIKDAVTGNDIKHISWPSEWKNIKIISISDRNNDGINELALLGVRKSDGRTQLMVKNPLTNASFGTWSWPANRLNSSFLEIADLNGDGFTEFGLFSINGANKVPQVIVKNGKNKSEQIATYSFPRGWTDHKIITLGDLTHDSVPEIALFGRHPSKGNSFLFIRDGLTREKVEQYTWGKQWNNITFSKLDDLNADGIAELSIFGVRKDDGRPQLLVKNGVKKQGFLTTYNWSPLIESPTHITLSDQNSDGIQEQAVFGLNLDSNKYQLIVKSGLKRGQTLMNYQWPNNWHSANIQEVNDLNQDGLNELALIGINSVNGTQQVQIRDRETRAALGTWSWPTAWSQTSLHPLAEATLNNVQEIGLFGNDSNGSPNLKIVSIDTNTTSTEISTEFDISANSSQVKQFTWSTPMTVAGSEPIDVHANQSEFDEQEWPRIAAASDGSYMVIWQSQSQGAEANKLNLYGRRFTPSGEALTNEIKINQVGEYSSLAALHYNIDSNSSGKSCVTWGAVDFSGRGAYVRCYDINGKDLTGAVLVDNGSDAWTEPEVDVAVFEDGSYAVVYQYESGFTTGFKVRRYSASGIASTPIWLETKGGWSRSNDIQIDTDGYGKIAITWSINDINLKVMAMVIDNDDQVIVPEFFVGDNEASTEETPDITMNDKGLFFVALSEVIDYKGTLAWYNFDSSGNAVNSGKIDKNVDARIYTPRITSNGNTIYLTWSEYDLGNTDYDDWAYMSTLSWEGDLKQAPFLLDSYRQHDQNTPMSAVSDHSVITVWDDPYREEYAVSPRDTNLNRGVFGVILQKN
ncbi:hypothetical protein MK852_24260 [Shewanella benthica]|uniref:hypothetical protein n=1 Tax=Shewanella benthica TaxID=43661 RepID=UPI00187A45EF|nr:hypothetical protein [Shewanella benthica]MBE7213935.1 hypothetical protein [Shewanella benthica]MCL1065196.1 hypothetical protein [Shewanella benthica]